MLSKPELTALCQADFHSCSPTDLRQISIDPAASLPVRMESFLQQAKNPYLVKVDDIVIRVQFHGERSLTEAFSALF